MSTATETKKGISEEQQRELDRAFERARKALAVIETYDQSRVDRLCQAVAWAVANKRTFTRLVKMGIEESGLGDPVSRMGKRLKIRGVLRDALRQKSVGIIEELPEKGIVKYGKPAGIVACIVPTTNPDLTLRVMRSTASRRVTLLFLAASAFQEDFVRDGASDARGAPTRRRTRGHSPVSHQGEHPDVAGADGARRLIIATGGQPMVRAAYSLGTPAYGVGAGNSTMIVDETANIEEAARNTRLSKTSDFGSGCSADGNLIIEASIFDRLLKQLHVEGGYLANAEEKAALRKVMWDEEGIARLTRWPFAAAARDRSRGFRFPPTASSSRPWRWHRQGYLFRAKS